MGYKSTTPLDRRVSESSRIRAKYPDRVPVIVERANNKTEMPDIDKAKFLVPSDLTVGQFVFVIRKRLSLSADKALFVFVNNSLPPTSMLLRELYTAHADPSDGFLYVRYSGESTFGEGC